MLDTIATFDSPGSLALVLAAALAAGLARGFSGFGAALIFVPMASAAVGPKVAVPLLLLVDGVLTLGFIPGAIRLSERRSVMTMAAGALVGVPAGVFLLDYLDPLTIRWTIVVFVAALLALLVSGWRYHGRPRAPLTALVGAVSGILSGVAQIGGPPVVAYWLGGAIPAVTVRANIIFYFAISTALSAVGYLGSGLFTARVLVLAVLLAPLYAAGLWLGSRMFRVASEQAFRRISYLMIAAAAIIGLPLLDGFLR